MKKFQEDRIKAHEQQTATADQLEWIRGIHNRLSPGPHNAVLSAPDDQARNFQIHWVPPRPGEPTEGFELSITGPDESAPEGAIASQSVAEARAEALANRRRARALASGSRFAGIPINRYGKESR